MKIKQWLIAAGALCILVAAGLLVMWMTHAPLPGNLTYKIYHKKTVMTVAYKAYGNPEAAEGKYWLSKTVLENSGQGPVRDIQVSYQIPGWIDWTTPDNAPELLPGQTLVLAYYPKLPAKVTHIRSRTPTSLEIKIIYTSGGKSIQKVEKRELELRGVTEIEYTSLPADELINWYDMFDNSELCAAYVTSEDDVIKAYLGKISETMGGLPVPSNRESLLKVMKAIYDFQCQTGMTYASAAGVPEKLGDVTSIVQNVRLPRDVITQNSGLCIELALLMNSLGQAAGCKAYLVMIPGHAYSLLEAGDGTKMAIECTGVGGRNLGGTMNFDQAVNAGLTEIKEVMSGSKPGIIVDIQAHQAQGLRPPELDGVDLAALNKMLGERLGKQVQNPDQTNNNNQPNRGRKPVAPPDGGDDTQVADNNDENPTPQPQPQPRPQPQPQPRPQPAGQFKWYQGNGFAVPYPGAWVVNQQLMTQVKAMAPWYLFNAQEAATQASLSVYTFSSTDPEVCMDTLSQFIGQFGLTLEFGDAEDAKIGNVAGQKVPYTLHGQSGQGAGELYMIPGNRQMLAFTIGAPTGLEGNLRGLVDKIVANVKLK